MEDHALAKAFPGMSRSIIRIITIRDGQEWGRGTGYIFGVLRKTQRAAITTAAHVLPLDESKRAMPGWHVRLEKFDKQMRVVRTTTFSTSPHDDLYGPHVAVDPAPGADTALLLAPRLADDGEQFFEDADITVPPTLDRMGPAPATRIAWAGFPSLLAQPTLFGSPHLCYYEGVVSTWAMHQERYVLVVDGHAMPGVSGGPVWYYRDGTAKVEVAGLISRYAAYETPESFHPSFSMDKANQKRDRMPGFVFVQPVTHLVDHALKLGRTDTPKALA